MNRTQILEYAETLINGQRAQDYGDAEIMFHAIANGWQGILQTQVTAPQVALCMAWLKMCRLAKYPDHLDSWADLIGYAALGAEIATKGQHNANI